MARCRRLDRSMPCLSSPLSRVASALLAFLYRHSTGRQRQTERSFQSHTLCFQRRRQPFHQACPASWRTQGRQKELGCDTRHRQLPKAWSNGHACQQLRLNMRARNCEFPGAAPHQKWSALSSGCAASPGRTAGGASRSAVTAYTTSAAYSCGPVPSSSLKLLQRACGISGAMGCGCAGCIWGALLLWRASSPKGAAAPPIFHTH